MSNEQLLLVVVAAVVVIGLLWYFRGRTTRSAEDLEFEQERHQAAAASEEVRTEAMVRRICPHCNAEVEASATVCPNCGYRFT